MPTGIGIVCVPTGRGIVCVPTGIGIVCVPTGRGIVCVPTGRGIVCVPTGKRHCSMKFIALPLLCNCAEFFICSACVSICLLFCVMHVGATDCKRCFYISTTVFFLNLIAS